MLTNLYSAVILLLTLCFAWLIEQALKIAYFVQNLRLALFSKRGLVSMMAVSFVMIPSISFAAISDDVTAAITTFAEVNAAIPVVGAAFLTVLGLLAAWKLIRGAF